MNKPLKFQETIRIPSYLCAPDDRLGIDGAASLLQEAAWQHAGLLGFAFAEADSQHFWVLHRVSMHFHRRPAWNERVTVTTWPSELRKLYALRDVTIDSEDGTRLVDIGSSWIILDAAQRRPVRPQQLLDESVITAEHVLDLETGRLPAIPAEHAQTLLEAATWQDVRLSDTDRNQHVNNGRYAQWFRDAAQDALQAAERATITFTREMQAGEQFAVIQDPERGIMEVWKRPEQEAACRLHVA